MRLIDCFIELIAYVAYFLKTVPASPPSFDQLKTDINHLIGKTHENFNQTSLSEEDFDLARFGVFAWIDEAILNSNWQSKSDWQSEQLQRIYYHTTDAGEIFFDKLNELTPLQNQVREAYYLCLALGFSGRYCNPGDEFLLDQLKNSNLKLLEGSTSLVLPGQTQLFPEGYHRSDEVHAQSTRKRRFSLGLALGISLPILLYGVLFFIYRFVLGNVGENVISLVH